MTWMFYVYIFRALEIAFLITTLKLGYSYLVFLGILFNIVGNTLHYQMQWFATAAVTKQYKYAETLFLSLFSSIGHVGKKTI